MFIIEASLVALLEVVATPCRLQHIGFEMGQDRARLVGIELDLPPMDLQAMHQTRFFWSAANVFRFVVSDYGHESMFFSTGLNPAFLRCV